MSCLRIFYQYFNRAIACRIKVCIVCNEAALGNSKKVEKIGNILVQGAKAQLRVFFSPIKINDMEY